MNKQDWCFVLQGSERNGVFRDFLGYMRNLDVAARIKLITEDTDIEKKITIYENCTVGEVDNWVVGWGPHDELIQVYDQYKQIVRKRYDAKRI